MLTDHIKSYQKLADDCDNEYNIERSIFVRGSVWIRNKEMGSILHFVENKPITTQNEQIKEHCFAPVFHYDDNKSCNHNKNPVFRIEATWIISCPNISLEDCYNPSNDICNDK